MKHADRPPRPECGAPEGPQGVYGCCTIHVSGNGEFGALVDWAQDRVLLDHPELFEPSGKVKDELAYTAAVVKILQAVGLCATQGGPADEIGVKNTNDWNEQYDIVLGNLYPRRDGYVAFCKPSRF